MQWLIPLVCLVALAQALTAPVGSRISSLPGYNGPPLSMYSGYITVDQKNGRALFYWLCEATKVNPKTAPLIFWFQGGPGCSGLGGFFTENGPLTPTPNGDVTATPVAWTDIANVVYLDQPAFVGFSYSNTSSDRVTGDTKSTADNYIFVKAFLEAFPDYKGRDTWFTGESYGGEYVPTLTAAVLQHPETQIYKQLKGIMVGNPVFNCGTGSDNTIQVNLYYWHGLVSYSNFRLWFNLACDKNQNTKECINLFNIISQEIGIIYQEFITPPLIHQPSLDPDDLYQNFCTGNGTLDITPTVPVGCQPIGLLLSNYLGQPNVQRAIHARGPNGGKPLKWVECTTAINYTLEDKSMVPLYANFHKWKPGFDVLVYSGDVDVATVPFAVTQPCLAELRATRTRNWGPWFVNGQTAGYWEQFDLYTYATVKGAGHETPQYQPLSAFNMFQRFLTSQSLVDPHDIPPANTRLSYTKRQGSQLRWMQHQQRMRNN